jgi:hypothetical protein
LVGYTARKNENKKAIRKSEPIAELEPRQSSDLPAKDVEMLVAELDASHLETEVDKKVEKIENAERPPYHENRLRPHR